MPAHTIAQIAAALGAEAHGDTDLSVTGAVEEDGYFYAPDPSSQLACAIAGNIAMNSGGAHCLKYGVTTNNLLGVTAVLMDGTVVEIGGGYLDAGGLDLLGVICGSEGQLAVVTEATLRILRKPEGARPVLLGYDSSEVAGQVVSDIIKECSLAVLCLEHNLCTGLLLNANCIPGDGAVGTNQFARQPA